MPSEEPEAAAAQSEASQTAPAAAAAREQQPDGGVTAWWRRQQEKSAALRKKLLALGPAAVLAYGLFDGLTYSVAFAIAFLGYEAKTGLNPTQNVADLVKICILMVSQPSLPSVLPAMRTPHVLLAARDVHAFRSDVVDGCSS